MALDSERNHFYSRRAVSGAAIFFPEKLLLKGIDGVLSVLTAALGIYVLLEFRRLLHRHRFHAAALVLALMIGGLVVGVVVEQGRPLSLRASDCGRLANSGHHGANTLRSSMETPDSRWQRAR